MDSSTEKNIRAEIAAINGIPYGDRTIEDKRRLNDLEAEILRRHFVLQSGAHPFQFPEEQTELFPETGVGSFCLSRSRLIEMVADEVINGKRNSLYFRAPRGCGKTFFSYLLGKKLLVRGKRVFTIKHAEILNRISEDSLKALETNHPDDRIFLIIDEVHSNQNSFLWNFLLKESKRIFTIGFGISDLCSSGLAFKERKKANFLFLSMDDFDDAAISLFMKLGNISDRAAIVNMLEYLLRFTGGHVFPLLKIAEYLVTFHQNAIIDHHIGTVIRNAAFYSSDTSKLILSRCFHFSVDERRAVATIFTSMKESEKLEEGLRFEPSGLWSFRTKWFISDLVLSYLFQDRDKVEKVADDLTIISLLAKGLSTFNESTFVKEEICYDDKPRYEIAVGHFFGWTLSGVEGLYVSPQHRTSPDSKLLVDFHINGKCNIFVELIFNSDHVKNHFEKFEKDNTRDSFVILDIKETGTEPAQYPVEHEKRFYTFLKQSNSLWLGQKMLKKNVSKSFHPTLIKHFSTSKLSTFATKFIKHL